MAKSDAKLNPTALSVANAARLLSAAGGQTVTVAMLETDIAAGAPTNADGTLNLAYYAAWLVREAGVRSLQSGGAGAGTDQAPGSRLRTPGSGLRTTGVWSLQSGGAGEAADRAAPGSRLRTPDSGPTHAN